MLFGGGKETLHPVIVGVPDGVELVVVAAGASECHAEKGRAHHVGHLGQNLVADVGLVLVTGIAPVGSQAVETGGHLHLNIARRHLVAGQLFGDKLVIGLVFGERADDVVAILPGLAAMRVVLKSIAFGEADHIQPLARLAFGILGHGEQAIHQSFVSLRRRVSHKFAHDRWRRRQADQVQGDAANQSLAASRRSVAKPLVI